MERRDLTPSIGGGSPSYTTEIHSEALAMNEGYDMGRTTLDKDEYRLYTNEAFRRVAPKKVSEASDRGQPIGVVIADIDSLKAINDEIGHYAGDKVIDKAKEILADMVADGLLVMAGRIGGDEFAALCLGSSEKTSSVAEKFEQKYRKFVEEDGNGMLAESGLDLSVGTANLSPDITTFSELMRSADEDMYHKKFAKLGAITLEKEIGLMAAKRELDKSDIRLRDAPKLWRQQGLL